MVSAGRTSAALATIRSRSPTPPERSRPSVPMRRSSASSAAEHGSRLHQQLLLRSDSERHVADPGGRGRRLHGRRRAGDGWCFGEHQQLRGLDARGRLPELLPAGAQPRALRRLGAVRRGARVHERLLHAARRKTLRSTRRQRDGGRRQQERRHDAVRREQPPLATANQLKGPNNPQTNFFASQINRDDGTLDTSGTFGTRNANAFTATNISGGRQGWDITNVDVSSQLRNAQTQAFAQGTTTGDTYVISALGLQIDVGAPVFPQRQVGRQDDDLRRATRSRTRRRVSNTGIVDATNVVFTDPPPPGTTFVRGASR